MKRYMWALRMTAPAEPSLRVTPAQVPNKWVKNLPDNSSYSFPNHFQVLQCSPQALWNRGKPAQPLSVQIPGAQTHGTE